MGAGDVAMETDPSETPRADPPHVMKSDVTPRGMDVELDPALRATSA